MSLDRTIKQIDEDYLKKSGKFFGEADRKFAGSPKGLLEKTAEKADWPRY
jgi:hypothetical protein